MHVDESELTLVANSRLAIKGEPNLEMDVPVRGILPGRRQIAIEAGFGPTLGIKQYVLEPRKVPGGTIEPAPMLGFGMGDDPMVLFNARWAITERLTWRIGTLGFSYRIGGTTAWELYPVLGIVGWESSLSARFVAGGGARIWVHRHHALNAQAHFEIILPTVDRTYYQTHWRSTGSLGYSLYIRDRAVMNFAIGGQGDYNRIRYYGHDLRLRLGSVQELGLRQLPLLEMFLSDRWAFEVFLAAEYRFTDHGEIWYDVFSHSGERRHRWIFPMALALGYTW
jgi:hypothetical protein